MRNYDIGDSLGSRSPDQIAEYLTEIGDLDRAKGFTQGMAGGQNLAFWAAKPYTQTGMVIGFIPYGGGKASEVVGISQVEGDRALVGKRIKITLDKFHVADYPGLGAHTILCEFFGKNQVPGETEELAFALRFKARDNSGPAIAGAPIFMGITVSEDGISFKGRTVNVANSIDDTILATLDTPAFKNGLALLNTAQPALKPLTCLAAAAVDTTLKRKKNVQVHSFDLGLDFAGGATSARLRHGSYVVVQTDSGAIWDWGQFFWNTDGLALQYRAEPARQLDFNYMVFGVTAFSDASARS